LSIKLRGTRNRRSYADYKPASRRQGSRNDPFRIIFYLVVIAGAGWALLNADALRAKLPPLPGQGSLGDAGVHIGPPSTATPQPDQLAGLALEAYKAGNLDKAIDLYTQAGEFAPDSVEYHFQVARLLLFESALQTGSTHDATLQKALDASNQVILADPEKPDGYAIYGKILDWQGHPDLALPQIQRALNLDKSYALGNSYLSEVLVDLQRWDQAQTAIDAARSAEPNNPDILRDYGYFLESQQDYAGAAKQYQASLAAEPNQPYVKLALARIYRATQQYNEALDQLFAVDTLSPKTALVEYEIGVTYESGIGDPTSAQKYYEQATQSDPNFALPWIRLGTIHFAQNSFQQAIPDFEEALKLGVSDSVKPRILVDLALAYANQGRCDQARANLEQAAPLVTPDQTDLTTKIEQANKQCPPLTPSPTLRPGQKPPATATPIPG